jgi:hypothetical protein
LAKVFKDQGSKSHFSLFSCLPTQKWVFQCPKTEKFTK